MHGCRDQPLMRDPTMGYLKLNLASQSRRLSISILPRPCKALPPQLSGAHLPFCSLQPLSAAAIIL